MFKTTDELVSEYKSIAGVRRRLSGRTGYLYPFAVDEHHTDLDGSEWYIVTAFLGSLDNWLMDQCENNEEYCRVTYPHNKWCEYPRYYIHSSLLTYITLRWL